METKKKKIKILTLSDSPLAASGIGLQTRQMIEKLLDSGKFQVYSFAGAIEHPSYNPIKTQEYQDDWIIFPVQNFGTQEQVRSFLMAQKPDILLFVTDPRFFTWLWEIAFEIRENVPMVYWEIWDNFPAPDYNKPYWDSNDLNVAMSKITYEMNKQVCDSKTNILYHPLSVRTNNFYKRTKEQVDELKRKTLQVADPDNDKFTFLWVNRNARRKHAGTLLFWFKDFLDEVGKDKARLILHTNPKDQFGQDLEAIVKKLNLINGEILFSGGKLSFDDLGLLNSVADCTINISDAEGFGLNLCESLACETPSIVIKTGGLQDQITDGENIFGIAIEPSSRYVVGSLDIPFIFEDRISKEQFISALKEMMNYSKEKRAEMGRLGREHVLKNFCHDINNQKWVDILEEVHEKCGSWETRKNYKSWFLKKY